MTRPILDASGMSDQQVRVAYARARESLRDTLRFWVTDSAPARTAQARWEALDREMARRGLERREG